MDLPRSSPSLDRFFARNGVVNIRELLEVNEACNTVSAREARVETAFVLVHTPREIIRDAHIQDTGATRHDIHVIRVHELPEWSMWVMRPSSFFRGLYPFPSPFTPCRTRTTACHPQRRRREGPAF